MKRRMALIGVLAAVGIIAGCRGSDETMAQADGFITFVKSVVSTSDDTAAAAGVDDVAASNSDTSDPVAVY